MSKKQILFIGDSLSTLKLASDTSIAFCEAALADNFEVFWCEKKDISFFNYEIIVSDLLRITYASNISIDFEKTDKQGSNTTAFSTFDYCFIRLNPPFDAEYTHLCWLLNTQVKVKIINPPSSLLNFHEKSFQLLALAEGVLDESNIIPTCISSSQTVIKEFLIFLEKQGIHKYVTKPWLGFGGADIKLWDSIDEVLTEMKNAPEQLVLQPYLEEIHTVGDRRVLIVNGEVLCSFVRLPPNGKIASNTAQGGSTVLRETTPKQDLICKKLASFLKKHSVNFAGLDLIGEKIGEINITSPTGIRIYEKLTNQGISSTAFKKIIQ